MGSKQLVSKLVHNATGSIQSNCVEVRLRRLGMMYGRILSHQITLVESPVESLKEEKATTRPMSILWIVVDLSPSVVNC